VPATRYICINETIFCILLRYRAVNHLNKNSTAQAAFDEQAMFEQDGREYSDAILLKSNIFPESDDFQFCQAISLIDYELS
jgi:hypothetical protein